jgi:hypothetical protein
MIIVVGSLDEPFGLRDRERTTLRLLASEGRLLLRRSRSYRPAGATEPRKAFWADVVRRDDPKATEQIEISEALFTELLAMGVPEELR